MKAMSAPEEINELKKQLDKAKMPVDVKREADKQLKRLGADAPRIF